MTSVKLVEWFDEHWYKITLEDKSILWCASVSTKLGVVAKPFLARWRGDIGNTEADLRLFEAQERGIRTHNAWYQLTTGGAVVYQPFRNPVYSNQELAEISEQHEGKLAVLRHQEEMWDVSKLAKWCEVIKPKFIESELTVYSLTHKEAGTLDNVVWLDAGEYMVNGSKPLIVKDSGLYILDLKSGSQVTEDVWMQIAPYAKCYHEMTDAEIKGGIVLHTQSKNKKGIEGLSTLLRTREQLLEDYADFRHVSAIWERKNKDAKPETFEFPSLLKLKKEPVNEAA